MAPFHSFSTGSASLQAATSSSAPVDQPNATVTPDMTYALICRRAVGEELVKKNGVWMTKRTAATTPKQFNINDLPFDARTLVLEHMLEARTLPVFLRGNFGKPPTAIPLLPITRAGDRKLRMESIIVAIKKTTLEIHSGPGNASLQAWLGSLDVSLTQQTNMRTGFDAVQKLLFPYFSRFPHHLPGITSNNDIGLMQRCSNLRVVTIAFVPIELVDSATGQAKSVATLRSEYHLHGMDDLPKLRVLKLKRQFAVQVEEAETAIEQLAQFFRGVYLSRNRVAQVKVV